MNSKEKELDRIRNFMFMFVMLLLIVVCFQKIIINHKVIQIEHDCVIIQKELYCRKENK